MEDYIPGEFGPDDDTEELPPREYRKAYEESRIKLDLDFPDSDLFKEDEISLRDMFPITSKAEALAS